MLDEQALLGAKLQKPRSHTKSMKCALSRVVTPRNPVDLLRLRQLWSPWRSLWVCRRLPAVSTCGSLGRVLSEVYTPPVGDQLMALDPTAPRVKARAAGSRTLGFFLHSTSLGGPGSGLRVAAHRG